MRIYQIINENLGSAVAQAVQGAASSVLNIFDVPPTEKQAAVNDLVSKWDSEWPKIVSKDPGARKKYGLALQSWLQGIFRKTDPNMINYIDRIFDVKQSVKNGRPNTAYIKSVFGKIFDAQKKRDRQYKEPAYSGKPRVRMKAATAK